MPGVIENSLKVAKGPMGLFGSFLGPNPQTCRTVTVKTRDINNKRGTESGILTDNDIKMISACSFSNNKNPVTGKNCSGFTLMYDVTEDDTDISKLPDDYIVRFFYGSVSLLALYLIYKVTNKNKYIVYTTIMIQYINDIFDFSNDKKGECTICFEEKN